MTILCCGDRNWTNYETIAKELVTCNFYDIIIHGNCKGADRISGSIALQLKLKVKVFSAKWSQYGKAAGPIRNQQMLDEGKPDLVLAFHTNLDASKGTRDMIKRATKANISVKIITQ